MDQGSDKGPVIAQGARCPRLVHQIWLGPGPLPPILGAFVDAAKWRCSETLWDWDHRLWSWGGLCAAFPQWSELTARCTCVAQQADVARLLILDRWGGLYLDVDVEPFALPHGLHGAWVAGTSTPVDPRSVNNYAMAAPPGHPYIRRMLAEIPRRNFNELLAAGPFLLADQFGPDVNIWPWHVWRGQRGQEGALGYHYGWGPRLKSFLRCGGMPPTG